jgi:hypothetical protein
MLTAAATYQVDLLSQLFPATGRSKLSAPTAARGAAGASASLTVVPKGHNILGVGYGAKSTMGVSYPDEVSVRVYVRRKLPVSALSVAERVPADINGTPTDVIGVGDIQAYWPCACGDSVGHKSITAGTIGAVVRKKSGDTTKRYILSNNHVLANSNACAMGDEILQPGPADGGTLQASLLARLDAWHAIDFAGGPNDIDAAIGEINTPANVQTTINTIGQIAAPNMNASLYQSVRKSGRTTGHTVGVILDVAATIKVSYGNNVAVFRDQLAVSGVGGNVFSAGGDSGSLVVDAVSKRPVGLLFAGGGGTTFVNPIDDVLTTLSIDIVV